MLNIISGVDETNSQEIHNFASSIEETGVELQDKKKCENTFLNGLEIDRGRVDSEKMSINTEKCLPITIDEKYIPTVIQGEIIPENSDKKKKSTRNVGRRKKTAK